MNESVMLNEAKTSRSRPELRGRGQFLEVEAKAENNYQKKHQIIIVTYDYYRNN